MLHVALSRQELERVYGAPCRPDALVTVELHGMRVRAHPLVAHHLVLTFQRAHRVLAALDALGHTPQRVDSYNCRNIAGTQRRSMHAYGLAWDVFRTPPNVPPPGGVYRPTAALHPVWYAVFRHAGFRLGVDWRSPDAPHIEWNAPPPA